MGSRISLDVHLLIVTIASEGSFIRASQKLGIAPPSLTRRISQLEIDLGTRLFNRTSRKLELTKAGRLFVMESTRSIEHADRACNLARYQARLESGPIRIGVSPLIHSGLVPHLLRLGVNAGGYDSIKLESATTEELKGRILHGALHSAIGVQPVDDKDLWVETVAAEGFAVCIPRNHPLSHKRDVTVKDFDCQRIFWIPASAHPGVHESILEYCRSQDVDPTFREVGGQSQALEAVALGAGLMLLPRSSAHLSRPGVVFRPLADRYLRIESAFFMRRDQRRGSIKDFVDKLVTQLLSLRIGGGT